MSEAGNGKNLVLIHLESISNLTLWQYRVELASVWKILEHSKYFSRFYVSATSTSMSIHSLLYGHDSVNDQKPRYLGAIPTDPYDRHDLFWDFESSNKKRMHFAIENILGNRIVADIESIPHLVRSSYPANLFTLFAKWLEERKRDGKNFLVLFQNDITHMASEDDAKCQAGTFPERTRVAYRALDESIGTFLSVLQQSGFLENTVCVFYGDHGDEFWTHTLSRGFAHGTAPYTNLVWTPLFIYENGNNAGVTTELKSIIDLREMLLKMTMPDEERERCLVNVRRSPFAGIRDGKGGRELAFSQNLYALQLEYSDLEKALTKAYSVTDGTYRLVASSAGKRTKEAGLELFYESLDPTNSRNLLDFFNLNPDGDITGLKPFSTIGDRTFPVLFTEETVKNLMETYHRLKRELYRYVRTKENEAGKLNEDGEFHVMPESAFRFARKRLRHDYDD